MLLESIREIGSTVIAAFDGVYGWLLETIAIILFVLIFNFLIKWILRRLHQRFEREKKNWQESLVRALYRPLSFYVWFLASVHILYVVTVKIFPEISIESRGVILSVGALLAFVWFLLRWKKQIVQHMVFRSKNREITIEQGKIGAIDKVATIAILFFAALILMEITNNSINAIIAFGGIGGLALAFASQEIIANFFGGFMIYLTHPFTIGDSILIPDHKIEGIVEEIGWYMTRVSSPDKRPIYIPNSIFSKLIVITPSRMSHRQVKETLKVCCDPLKLKQATQEMKEMLQQHLDLDHTQPLFVRLTNIGDYSFNIDLSAFTLITNSEAFMKIREDILYKIFAIMKNHEIDFANPTRNISLLEHQKKV